jgi:hypothetical protein
MPNFRTGFYPFLTLGLASLYLLSAGSALAAGPERFSRMNQLPSESSALPAPIDAQQLWGRLYQLLRTTAAPTQAQFEAALGSPMHELLIDGDATFYAVTAGGGPLL